MVLVAGGEVTKIYFKYFSILSDNEKPQPKGDKLKEIFHPKQTCPPSLPTVIDVLRARATQRAKKTNCLCKNKSAIYSYLNGSFSSRLKLPQNSPRIFVI